MQIFLIYNYFCFPCDENYIFGFTTNNFPLAPKNSSTASVVITIPAYPFFLVSLTHWEEPILRPAHGRLHRSGATELQQVASRRRKSNSDKSDSFISNISTSPSVTVGLYFVQGRIKGGATGATAPGPHKKGAPTRFTI